MYDVFQSQICRGTSANMHELSNQRLRLMAHTMAVKKIAVELWLRASILLLYYNKF